MILSGFNSDLFDFPYIYYRLKNLYNGSVESVSKLFTKIEGASVNINKFGGNSKVNFVEYINADILYLFKPRGDGGLLFAAHNKSCEFREPLSMIIYENSELSNHMIESATTILNWSTSQANGDGSARYLS
jgi:DNA polymerase elongation subunit (family B)